MRWAHPYYGLHNIDDIIDAISFYRAFSGVKGIRSFSMIQLLLRFKGHKEFGADTIKTTFGYFAIYINCFCICSLHCIL